jgi:hypothetical protein
MNQRIENIVKHLSDPIPLDKGKTGQLWAIAPNVEETVFKELPEQKPQKFGLIDLYRAKNPTSWAFQVPETFTGTGKKALFIANDLELNEAVEVAREFDRRCSELAKAVEESRSKPWLN